MTHNLNNGNYLDAELQNTSKQIFALELQDIQKSIWKRQA